MSAADLRCAAASVAIGIACGGLVFVFAFAVSFGLNAGWGGTIAVVVVTMLGAALGTVAAWRSFKNRRWQPRDW